MPTKSSSISAGDFRQQLGTYMDRVYYKGERFVVKRAGKPMVEIRPLPEKVKAKTARKAFMEKTQELRATFSDMSEEEIKDLVADAVEWARTQRQDESTEGS